MQLLPRVENIYLYNFLELSICPIIIFPIKRTYMQSTAI